jgi:diacylglycerol O-acyltransferase / wax synthase
MSKNIPPLDLLWLLTETVAGPTHVGGVMLFEKPKARAGSVVRQIVDAFRAASPRPPFNYVPELAGAGWPHFREAERWDPDYHVQYLAMPADACYEDFLKLIASLHEPTLDRSRPLFRTWVIDGLPNDRFAIYSKVSHAIIDGESGMRRLYASMSTTPRGRMKPPTFAMDMPGRRSHRHQALAARAADAGAAAARQASAVKDVYVHALGKVASLLSGASPSGSMPFTAQHGPMNEPLTPSRSYATLSLPLDDMRSVGRQYGATLNDMVMTLVDEGVHRYLRRTDRAFPHRLVAFCPISLREKDDVEAATKVTAAFVHLGGHDATVTERIGQVVAAMTAAKTEIRSLSKEAAMVYAVAVLGLAQASTASGIGRVAPPLANLVISNVPGAPHAMYVNGARLLGMYSASAIAADIGLNVTVSSYDGRMDFGMIGSGATMHSLPSLASHIADAFEELKGAASTRSRRRPAQGDGKRGARVRGKRGQR